jgi:hypothetical protein
MLVYSDPPEVCSLSGGMMLPDGAIPIGPITEPPSLSPASSTRRRTTRPCGSASTSLWATTGLPSSVQMLTSGLDGSCIPVGMLSAFPQKLERNRPRCRFGQSLSASLAPFRLRDVNGPSLVFVLPLKPSPRTG